MQKKPNTAYTLLGPKRRLVQYTLTGLFFLVPFLQINHKSLFRINPPELTLDLFWQTYHIEEFFLFWLLALGTIFCFILMTIVLGRVWCGWLCPQTLLSDLADFLRTHLMRKPEAKFPNSSGRATDKSRSNRIGSLVLLHLSYMGISMVFGAAFVWYFVPPNIFFPALLNGRLGIWPTGTILVMAGLTYINFSLVRRLFCKEFCPYGRFQTILVDKATLTLQAHPYHRDRCIDCQACTKVCPTGIDIRSGFQVECINCAKCLDACRKVMASRGEPGIIQYTFGPQDLGWRSLLNPKVITIAAVALTLLTIFFIRAANRVPITFKIGQSAKIASRLVGNNLQMTFFSGSIRNHTQVDQVYFITVTNSANSRLEVKGAKQFFVAADTKSDINFAVLSAKASAAPFPITLRACTANNTCVQQKAFIPQSMGTNQ